METNSWYSSLCFRPAPGTSRRFKRLGKSIC
jgi:hypothetical protein